MMKDNKLGAKAWIFYTTGKVLLGAWDEVLTGWFTYELIPAQSASFLWFTVSIPALLSVLFALVVAFSKFALIAMIVDIIVKSWRKMNETQKTWAKVVMGTMLVFYSFDFVGDIAGAFYIVTPPMLRDPAYPFRAMTQLTSGTLFIGSFLALFAVLGEPALIALELYEKGRKYTQEKNPKGQKRGGTGGKNHHQQNGGTKRPSSYRNEGSREGGQGGGYRPTPKDGGRGLGH